MVSESWSLACLLCGEAWGCLAPPGGTRSSIPSVPIPAQQCPMVMVAQPLAEVSGFCSGVTLTSTAQLHHPPGQPAVAPFALQTVWPVLNVKVKGTSLISWLLWVPGETWWKERAGSHLCYLRWCWWLLFGLPRSGYLEHHSSVVNLQCDLAASVPPSPSSVRRAYLQIWEDLRK